jgi:hypothetical protein
MDSESRTKKQIKIKIWEEGDRWAGNDFDNYLDCLRRFDYLFNKN